MPKPKPCIPSSKVICPCEDAPEQPTCRGYNGDGSGGVAYPEKDTGGPEPDPDPTDAADDGADITDAGDASDV